MKELKQIIEIYTTYLHSGKRAALATVVKVDGSAYRRPGARMLIMEDGQWKGSVSGGCLEGDALKKARKVMDGRETQLLTYDTREEGAHDLYLGLGCHGRIEIILEPLHADDPSNPILSLQSFFQQHKEAVLATVLQGEGLKLGTRHLWIEQDASLPGTWEAYAEGFYRALEEGKSVNMLFKEEDKQTEIFFEYLNPGLELYVFGAGLDVVPISEMAKVLGWKVFVYDNCVAHLAPKRIPGADALNFTDFCSLPKDFSPGRFSAALVMSHSYKFDANALKFLQDKNVPYVGLMGPKKRFERMLEEFPSLAVYQEGNRLHNPIGLDIGAETPEEIALSILSEIKAFFAGRPGRPLTEKKVPIHERHEMAVVNISSSRA
jgi:xanthine dehydrogenase accessory factor